MLKVNLIRKVLSYFLSKPLPSETIPAGGGLDEQADFYSVYLKLGDDLQRINVESIDDERLYGRIAYVGPKNSVHWISVSVGLHNVPWGKINVDHFYKRWKRTEGTILSQFRRRLLGLHRYELWKQLRYDRSLSVARNRYQVLLAIEKLDAESFGPVNDYRLMEELYGPLIYDSTRAGYVRRKTRQLLKALEKDECVQLMNDYVLTCDVKLLPKAMTVMAEYEIDHQRHTDAQKSAKAMEIATRAMAVAVVIQAGLELAKFYLPIINP